MLVVRCGAGGEGEFIKITRGLSLSKVFELSLFVPIAELSITFTFFPVSVKPKEIILCTVHTFTLVQISQ